MKSTKDSLLEDIKAEFAEVNAMMEALEAKEPEDEASEAYDRITHDTYRLQDDTGTVEGYPVYIIQK